MSNHVQKQDREMTPAERYGQHLMNLAQALGMSYTEPSHRLLDRVRELRTKAESHLERSPVNIVFDGPPSHESGRFVEVEDDSGASIRIGDWSPYAGHEGWWVLRITDLPVKKED